MKSLDACATTTGMDGGVIYQLAATADPITTPNQSEPSPIGGSTLSFLAPVIMVGLENSATSATQ